MSQQNVELVRDYFGLVDEMLAEYWADPVPLEDFPALNRAFEKVHPAAEWTPPYLEKPLRGRKAWLESINDWFDAAEHWRIHLDGVSDLGGDNVLVESRNEIRGKGSGLEVEQGIFTVVTVREGLIAVIRDFPDRESALEAAGPG